MADQVKKKRTDLDRAYDRSKAIKGEIAYWIKHYARHGATFEFFLKWRDERVYGNAYWDKLQQWAKAEVNQYFNYVFAEVDKCLISTSVFNGRRLMHGHPALEAAREVYEQEQALEAEGKATGCWCYAFCDTRNGNKLLLVPYREEDRAKEIASGRLTEADIKALFDPGVIPLQRGHQPNGKACLSVRVAIPVNDDNTVQLPPNILRS